MKIIFWLNYFVKFLLPRIPGIYSKILPSETIQVDYHTVFELIKEEWDKILTSNS